MAKRAACSKAELEIARVVWDLGTPTVRQVLEALPSDRRLDYKTVQTYLRRLEAKGYLESHRDGRAAARLRPRVRPAQVIRETLEDLLNRLFGGRSLAVGRTSDHRAAAHDPRHQEVEGIDRRIGGHRRMNATVDAICAPAADSGLAGRGAGRRGRDRVCDNLPLSAAPGVHAVDAGRGQGAHAALVEQPAQSVQWAFSGRAPQPIAATAAPWRAATAQTPPPLGRRSVETCRSFERAQPRRTTWPLPRNRMCELDRPPRR